MPAVTGSSSSSSSPTDAVGVSFGENVILGGCAASFAGLLTNPLEVIKTRIQTRGVVQPVGVRPEGYLSVASSILRNEGPNAFYKGAWSFLSYQFAFNGVRLASFDFFYAQIRALRAANESDGGVLDRMAAGMMAGICGSVLANPLAVIKNRQQAVYSVDELPNVFENKSSGRKPMAVGGAPAAPAAAAASAGKSMGTELREILRGEGVPGLLRGASVAVPRVMIGSGVQLTVYGTAKEYLTQKMGMKDDHVSQGVASVVAISVLTLVSTPFDLVMSRLQRQRGALSDVLKLPQGAAEGFQGTHHYSSAVDCVQKVVRHEGVLTLWSGATAFFMRFLPHASITLVVWEGLKKRYADSKAERQREELPR
uniref:Mitochondrial carrier protein n=1 Tax=Chromera velia CCMP2878 TaxID=1169474 RepID=A0A0G4HA89_9ALVE|eukprot:Cvel_6019.t1-p1 / transcript=Cvel_6019.t1 / gene=Cvel_6019 / organism=Chromera_velia_CCMP2878 / gene_product=Solute carrier family 25 member 34, putative / transcript_product=Solute carrier family 25 member 34, putative / location=Cvel_scaffold288:71827-74335(-) / protein_length=367 / sequence_SO=supercontig / SO=protein_coding / is_pseudo=false